VAAPATDETMSDARSRWTLPPPLRGVRAAFVFLTRIPVGGFPYCAEDWKWAAAHAPLVGVVVGLATGGVDRLLAPVGELPAAALAIAFSMLVTGAFHEDGLADTSDALGGATDRARVFAILKDSRVGTFGAAALVVSIVVRASLVAELGRHAVPALVLAGTAARAVPIWLMATLPYVTDDASSKSRAVLRGGYAQGVVATTWVVVVVLVCIARRDVGFERAIVLTVVLGFVGMLTAWRYRRRAGGITGDFLGATEQLCEMAALAVLAYSTSAP
jgi:adenosylcobinamide-GDP ribazoletransferase